MSIKTLPQLRADHFDQLRTGKSHAQTFQQWLIERVGQLEFELTQAEINLCEYGQHDLSRCEGDDSNCGCGFIEALRLPPDDAPAHH